MKNDICFYRGVVFTGVAYFFSGCVMKNAIEYKMGERVGEFYNKYLPDVGCQERIYFECLKAEDEEDEPLFYHGKIFSGVAYDFDGDFFSGEFLYKNGWLESQITYYLSGALDAVELVSEDFYQKYYWYQDGSVKRLDISESNLFEITLAFDLLGRVSTLCVDGDYFERIEKLSDTIEFRLFSNRKFARDLKGADYLSVSGSSIDDALFGDLLANDGLSLTSVLSICNTSLTAAVLNELVSIDNISQLIIESSVITLSDVKKFKILRPGCCVEFNQENIMN